MKKFEFPKIPKEEFIANGNPVGYAIEFTASHAIAGTIGFSRCGDSNKKCEVRIFLSKDYWNKHIGREAVEYFVFKYTLCTSLKNSLLVLCPFGVSTLNFLCSSDGMENPTILVFLIYV